MKPFLAILGVALPLAFASSASAGPSPKKGVGTWSFNGESQAMTSVDATWFYTWSTGSQGNTVPSTVSFVPMIWGSASVTTANLDAVKTEGNILLGFNEPDMTGQSNLTPAQALALWPQLVATGMRLGSPAVASNAQKAGGWLDTFISGAQTMNLPVDFICLHWYGGNFDPTMAVSELSTYVQETHAKFGLPIWVTEFALTNFSGGVSYPTEAQQAAFAAAAVDMLESTSYVERYAWFALPPCADGTGSSSCAAGNTRPLALDGGALTSVGVAYAGAGPDGGATEAGAAAAGSDGGAVATTDDSGAAMVGDATVEGDAGTSSGGGATTTSSSSGGGSATGDGGGASRGGAGSSSSGCGCVTAGRPGETGGPAPILAFSGLVAGFWLRQRRRRDAPRS